MIPINGKPAIGWILEDLISKKITEATIVMLPQDQHFKDFLDWAFCKRMDLTLAESPNPGTVLDSLHAGFPTTGIDGPIRIILGDTLIQDTFEFDQDVVYTGQVEESNRWCVVETDNEGRILKYNDKVNGLEPPLSALAGYYHLLDGRLLQQIAKQCIETGEHELSNVLRKYGETRPITARQTTVWFDFGNIDNLVDARRRLLKPRSFNSLKIDPVLNTITKESENDSKLRDELDWYIEIPDELKVLTPRLVSHRHVSGRLRIVQEYYGYPTLAELFVYGDLYDDIWQSILRSVIRVHDVFRGYSGLVTPDVCHQMYFDKTWSRLEKLKSDDPYWMELLGRESITINGRKYRGVEALWDDIDTRSRALELNLQPSIIHGDLCFSNILFDLNSQIIRLIDPRGSFGQKGIYGDPRYDAAKLRHSASGLYDFIVSGLFTAYERNGELDVRIFSTDLTIGVGKALDRILISAGYNIEDIQFIEGLLFLSMPPLHSDNTQRQVMMLANGLRLLNEVLE